MDTLSLYTSCIATLFTAFLRRNGCHPQSVQLEYRSSRYFQAETQTARRYQELRPSSTQPS